MSFDTKEQDNEVDIRDSSKDKEKKAGKIDRSSSKYSESDFLQMSRSEQLALAEKYWNGPVADFDDGTFQFSYTHFSNLCQKIGFKKGVVDTLPDNAASDQAQTSTVIYIERGRREATELKRFSLSKSTINKMEQLLGDKLSNLERSKVLDAILAEALDQKLADKRSGRFRVAYKAVDEETIL